MYVKRAAHITCASPYMGNATIDQSASSGRQARRRATYRLSYTKSLERSVISLETRPFAASERHTKKEAKLHKKMLKKKQRV